MWWSCRSGGGERDRLQPPARRAPAVARVPGPLRPRRSQARRGALAARGHAPPRRPAAAGARPRLGRRLVGRPETASPQSAEEHPMSAADSYADLLSIYSGSDGAASRALYDRLEACGPAGRLARDLFRAAKASERAKVYRGGERGRGSYKGMAYDRKQ